MAPNFILTPSSHKTSMPTITMANVFIVIALLIVFVLLVIFGTISAFLIRRYIVHHILNRQSQSQSPTNSRRSRRHGGGATYPTAHGRRTRGRRGPLSIDDRVRLVNESNITSSRPPSIDEVKLFNDSTISFRPPSIQEPVPVYYIGSGSGSGSGSPSPSPSSRDQERVLE